MIARMAFLTVSSCAALRTSLHFNSRIHKWEKPRLFSSPLKRCIVVSCAGPPLERPDTLLHGRIPSFEGAGVKFALEFVREDEFLDNVEWNREEGLDSLASELVEVYEELQLALASKNEVSIFQRDSAHVSWTWCLGPAKRFGY
eukprot:GFKZ01003163.1.p1 GENE.GFKZ01003163.1~~GFKZ01003163.1.p1  ORF type:complete len:144 (+),score=15.11 GFKZ01003163.1:364-795(+)